MFDLVLISTRVITPDGMKKAAVQISGDRIVAVTDAPSKGDFILVDLGDKVLMPGIIDPHVHINEPGRRDWEGFNTATKAAVAGGVTSLVDMPLNASPVTTTVEALEDKIKITRDQLHTNCGFWGGIIPGNENEIEPLIEKGVLGFKAFLTHSGIDEFPNVTEDDLRKAMPIIAKHGLPLLVHCELETTQNLEVNPDSHRDQNSYNEYLASRPKEWENSAIELMIRLCEEFNCKTHIVHLSSADAITSIKKAKDKGLPITVETGQHYLYFSAENIEAGQTAFKCAPPIREETNRKQLWAALKEGIIDFVATDHSPAPPHLKEISSGNFMKAWGGISSLQFSLPVLWTAARKENCSITDISKWLCERPAILPGLQHRKGMIREGFDADFVVWDPEKQFVVRQNIIRHKHLITPYLNEELYGVVEQTWLSGKKVFDQGKFLHLNKGNLLLK